MNETPQQVNTITLEDLVSVAEIINVCASRGAFKADELTTVGGLYDRLVAFLKAAGVGSKSEPTPESAPTPAPDSNTQVN
jgi:hypothetical protein